MERFEVVVVGAGHAGCEAALACARLGLRTAVFTLSLDNVALMPCNPSVGGPAKGHLVREIDALGGEMGRNTDATYMHIRRLNAKKGPAVRALRAQTDRKRYSLRMKAVLESQPGLFLREGCVEEILVKSGRVAGVRVRTGEVVQARCVVVAGGTYLRSVVHIGDVHYPSGPQGQHRAEALSGCLEDLGFKLCRFKTGTPPRVNGRSVDRSKMSIVEGESLRRGFSFERELKAIKQVPCWLTYTNKRTHEIISANLKKAAMYSGAIVGTGPRYCPSIESKIVQFPDKDAHQVFVEPEGWETTEVYLSGISTSLPADIQVEMLRTVRGLENVEVMRPGYAIEYDCLVSHQLKLNLEAKQIEGLFFAGQINGTSGYEEAAAQGLMAGINAVRRVRGEEPFILRRDEAYIGVLIDDLVTKGTEEPYRMLTSRAEYRLLLREDNADRRLTPYGWQLGLISQERYDATRRKWERVEKEVERLRAVYLPPGPQVNAKLEGVNSSALREPVSAEELLRRPEVSYGLLAELGYGGGVSGEIGSLVEMEIKYAGYIRKQEMAVARFRRLEERELPGWLDYKRLEGLSREAREKLERVRPRTLGQAARISGVSPADISVLMVYLEQRGRSGRGERGSVIENVGVDGRD